MDYRCPHCGANLGRRKLTQAVVTRMEIDCSACKRRIRLNVHRTETFVVLLDFAAILAFAALAYWLESPRLMLFAFGAAMLGALILPLLERTYLRDWPRYVPEAGSGDS